MGLVLYQQTAEKYLEEIRLLGNPNYIDDRGIPALCKAIYKFRDVALVEALLRDGANVNEFTTMSKKQRNVSTIEWWKAWGNFSAIHIAVSVREIDIIRLLLEHGADPNALTTNGSHTLLIEKNHYFIRDRKLGLEANSLEILKLLIERGSDVNVRNKGAQTLLHLAILQREHDIAKYLLSVGCDPNDVDGSGRTPLHSIGSDLECARMLLEKKANPNIQTMGGETVCHVMVRIDSVKNADIFYDIIRLLLDNHLDLSIADNSGNTVLHLCFKQWESLGFRPELLKLLLENGADPNVADELSLTPVFYLFSYLMYDYSGVGRSIELPELIKLLIQYGATFDTRDIMGQPLVHLLVKGCFEYSDETYLKSVIGCIQGHIDFNMADLRKRTALHLVSARGNWGLGRLLLEHGADKNAKDCDGNSPLHVAIESNEYEFAKRLLVGEDARASVFIGRKCRQARPARSHVRSQSSIANNGHSFAVPLGYSLQYTPEVLSTLVGKYVESVDPQSYFGAGIWIESKRSDETWLYTSPLEMPKELARCISSTSLADVCEEKSMGDFHSTGECGEEQCHVFRQVCRFVKDLLHKCAEIDPRFECNLISTGSSAEGTKMWVPDEFDFMMELTKLKDQCQLERGVHGIWPIITLRNESQELWADILQQQVPPNPLKLSPLKIRRRVAGLLWAAAFALDRTNYEQISFNFAQYSTRKLSKRKEDFIQITNVGVMLTFYWLTGTYRNLKINVDLTPAIPVHFPSEYISSYLNQHAIGKLDSDYNHAIPYMSSKNNYLESWRMSFSLSELNLIRSMTEEQVRLYKCLKLFRDMCQTGSQAAVPSYILKCFCFNLFFEDKWERSREPRQFSECMREVLASLETHCYPHRENNVENYFMVHKPLDLWRYDTRWCSVVEEYLRTL